MQKWNEKTKTYKEFTSPAKNPVTYSSYMSAEVECANCGRFNLYGRMYTSRRIHNDFGIGYVVCNKCYDSENKHIDKYRNKKL